MAIKLVSIVTGGSNNHETSSAEINGIATDFISQGVVGAISATSGVAPTTGAFAVNQIGTPTMDVRVTNGVAYVTATPTGGSEQTFRVTMDATEDVTIAANATGGTRYDWIYLKLDADKLVNPAVDASDVATLTTSRSTSASTDNGTPPTYGYCIAVVTVANGASSITNANITDSRTRTGATNLTTSTASNNVVTAPMLATNAITLGYSEATANQSGISSVTDLTNLSVTVTVPAGGRRIRIHGHVHVEGSTTNLIKLQIREGSTMLNATRIPNQSTTGGWSTPMDAYYIGTPTAGSHTYKLSLAVEGGGGTVTMSADAATSIGQAFILVELI